VALYGSPQGLEVVRRYGVGKRPAPRDRSQRGDLHALDDDGMVLCNPRDKEAAHRAEMEGIATEDRAAVTCRKCLRLLYRRDKAREERRGEGRTVDGEERSGEDGGEIPATR